MPMKCHNDWTAGMTVDQMHARVTVLARWIDGSAKPCLRPVLKKQLREILSELENRGILRRDAFLDLWTSRTG